MFLWNHTREFLSRIIKKSGRVNSSSEGSAESRIFRPCGTCLVGLPDPSVKTLGYFREVPAGLAWFVGIDFKIFLCALGNESLRNSESGSGDIHQPPLPVAILGAWLITTCSNKQSADYRVESQNQK